MTEPTPVQVDSHTWRNRTARDITAVIMAITTGLAILLLTSASILDAYMARDLELSPAYTSLMTGTLGVMVGAIAAYLGGRANDPEPATQRGVPAATAGVGSDGTKDSAGGSSPGGRHAVDTPTETIEPIRDDDGTTR